MDDVFFASNKLPKGTRWNMESGAMEWSQEQAENENMDQDSRTMEEISKLAGSIFKCLRFTWDCAIKNQNLKMPVLDTQLWLGLESRESGIHPEMDANSPKITKIGTLKRVILYQFYKKSMASRTNNQFSGGILLGSKIATGTQEVIRRLKKNLTLVQTIHNRKSFA